MLNMKILLIVLLLFSFVFSGRAEPITISGTDNKLIASGQLNEAFHPDKAISFKWKCDFSFPVRYVVFSFTRESDGKEFFVYYGNVNACTYFLADKWYEVSIPMTELRAHPDLHLNDGDTLSRFNFWLENNAGHSATFYVEKPVFSSENTQVRLTQEPEPIKIWPRTEPVPVFQPNQNQFMFIELPPINFSGKLKLELSNLTVLDSLTGTAPALPPNELTIHPENIKFTSQVSTLSFPARDYNGMPQIWIPLLVHTLSDNPITIKVIAEDKVLLERSFMTRQVQLHQLQTAAPVIAAWYFTGLNSEFVPVFTDTLMKAGVNSFYAMDGERVNGTLYHNTVRDYADAKQAKTGTAFFTSKFMQFCNRESLWELIDNGEFKDELKRYLLYLTGGKTVDVVIYDAETGAIKPGDKISGDTSEYAINRFIAHINSNTAINTKDIIANHHLRNEWIRFNCMLSNTIAKLSREAVHELWPDAKFKVYSGYEYDWGKQKNLTRERYAVDWQTMASGNIDYAGAGYNASMDILRHMNRVMADRAEFIPAEAYLWGFDSTQSGSYSSDRMFIRLFEAFVNSGLHGISIWQAHVLDPAALESVNRFAIKAAELSDFEGADVEYAPMSFPENVRPFTYILRKNDLKAIVYINNSNNVITISPDKILEPFSVYIYKCNPDQILFEE